MPVQVQRHPNQITFTQKTATNWFTCEIAVTEEGSQCCLELGSRGVADPAEVTPEMACEVANVLQFFARHSRLPVNEQETIIDGYLYRHPDVANVEWAGHQGSSAGGLTIHRKHGSRTTYRCDVVPEVDSTASLSRLYASLAAADKETPPDEPTHS